VADLSVDSNDPPHWTVIWIESDGSTGIPDGALTFGVSIPTGWAWPDDYKGFFLKGAAVSLGGGTQGGWPTGHDHNSPVSHTHVIPGHYHDSGLDNHPYATLFNSTPFLGTKIRSENKAGYAVVKNSTSSVGHMHIVTAFMPVPSDDETSGTVNVTVDIGYVPLLGFRHLYLLRNDTGAASLPVGIIVAYRGASVPTGWELVSYMKDRTPRGISVVGELGYDHPNSDTSSHYHGIANHTHTQPDHHHDLLPAPDSEVGQNYENGLVPSGSGINAMAVHDHGLGSLNFVDASFVLDVVPRAPDHGTVNYTSYATAIASYYTVMYIQYVGSPGKIVSYLNPVTNICEVLTTDTTGKVLYRRGVFASPPEVSDIPIITTLDVDGTPEAIIVLPDGTRVAMISDASGVRKFVSTDYGVSWEEE
jgi:hypothetical protein